MNDFLALMTPAGDDILDDILLLTRQFVEARDRYAYPETEVFRNKLDIRNDQELLIAEEVFGGGREYQLQNDPKIIGGVSDFARLKAIHRYLFQDLYDWAGEIRTVNIEKGFGWFSFSRFADSDAIEQLGSEIFAALKLENYLKGLDPKSFSERAAHYYDQLNVLHPFRDGNGRALRVFMQDLAREAGYQLDLTKIDRDTLIKAAVAVFNGGDRKPLAQIFEWVIVEECHQARQDPKQRTSGRSTLSENIAPDQLSRSEGTTEPHVTGKIQLRLSQGPAQRSGDSAEVLAPSTASPTSEAHEDNKIATRSAPGDDRHY